MHPSTAPPALAFGCGTKAGVPINDRTLLQCLSPNIPKQVTPGQPWPCTPPAHPGPAAAALADVPALPGLPRQLPRFPRGRAGLRAHSAPGAGWPCQPRCGTGSPEHTWACTLAPTAGSGRTPRGAVAPQGQALQGQIPPGPRPPKARAPRPRPRPEPEAPGAKAPLGLAPGFPHVKIPSGPVPSQDKTPQISSRPTPPGRIPRKARPLRGSAPFWAGPPGGAAGGGRGWLLFVLRGLP